MRVAVVFVWQSCPCVVCSSDGDSARSLGDVTVKDPVSQLSPCRQCESTQQFLATICLWFEQGACPPSFFSFRSVPLIGLISRGVLRGLFGHPAFLVLPLALLGQSIGVLLLLIACNRLRPPVTRSFCSSACCSGFLMLRK